MAAIPKNFMATRLISHRIDLIDVSPRQAGFPIASSSTPKAARAAIITPRPIIGLD